MLFDGTMANLHDLKKGHMYTVTVREKWWKFFSPRTKTLSVVYKGTDSSGHRVFRVARPFTDRDTDKIATLNKCNEKNQMETGTAKKLLERYIDPNYEYNQQVNSFDSSHTEVPYIEERDEDVNKLVLSDNEIIDIQSGWKHTKQEDSSYFTIDKHDELPDIRMKF